MKEKVVLGVFVFSVLMILVLLFFAFQSRITGKAIGEISEEAKITENKPGCSDSDGVNYNIKGTAEYCDAEGKCSSYEDSCSGRILTEWSCQGDEAKNEEHECEVECNDGICLKIAKEYNLIGSGSGGGGGGSAEGSISTPAATTSTEQTYDLGEIVSEQAQDILKKDSIQFSILGKGYLLTLQDNTETQATFAIGAQSFSLKTGIAKNVDLNNDGISDLYLKLNSINIITHKVKVILDIIS